MTTSTQAPAQTIKPVARPKTDLPYLKPAIRKSSPRRPKPAAPAPVIDNRPAVVFGGTVTLFKGGAKAEFVFEGQTVIARRDPETGFYRPPASVPVVFDLYLPAEPRLQPSPEDITLYG